MCNFSHTPTGTTPNDNAKVHPFFGLGLASVLPRGALPDIASDKNAASQVLAGLVYRVNDQIDATFDYHYLHLFHIDLNDGFFAEATNYHLPDENLINLGVQYHIAA